MNIKTNFNELNLPKKGSFKGKICPEFLNSVLTYNTI